MTVSAWIYPVLLIGDVPLIAILILLARSYSRLLEEDAPELWSRIGSPEVGFRDGRRLRTHRALFFATPSPEAPSGRLMRLRLIGRMGVVVAYAWIGTLAAVILASFLLVGLR